jgi:EmrB/QacA subfamily drug resistance transporter
VESTDNQAWRALAVGAAGFILVGFNSTATNLAFGAIGDTFADASPTLVAWVASGYFIASAAFLPLGGRLADRLGRRRIFNVGLIGFIVTAIVSAVAPNIWVLIASRVGQAVAGALVIPSSLAMALPDFPQARRSSAVATWASAGPLSAALAPSIAAGLLSVSSWRWVYFVSAPFALAVLGCSLVIVNRSKAEEDPGRLDLAGTVLATAAIALLIIGIGQAGQAGTTDPGAIGAIVAAVALGIAFLTRSKRHPTPLINLSLFRIPEVAVGNLANLFMSTTSLSIWLVWPLWLGRVWGYPTSRVGLGITVGPICAGMATLAGGRLADRYGQRWLMIVGSAITCAAVMWSFFMLGPEPDYVREFLPTIMGFGIGWGLSNPSMNSWALSRVPQDSYGEVNASFNTIRNLGAAVGTSTAIAIVGSADRPDVLEAYDRANLFFASSVALSCLSVAAGSWWIARRRAEPQPIQAQDPSYRP